MSPERERLNLLVDKLGEEVVGGVTDAPELVAAEVMVGLQERERRIAEAYARATGQPPSRIGSGELAWKLALGS